MTIIIENHTYRAATLPEAPERATRAEAEADEKRGVELAAYLALLPGVSDAQWEKAGAAWDAAAAAALGAAWAAAWAAARDVGRSADWGAAAVRVAAAALVVRDRITTEQFETLVAPMRAAGIDFDNLTTEETQ